MRWKRYTRTGFLLAMAGVLGAAACIPFGSLRGPKHMRRPIVRIVADRVIEDFPSPPPFNWGEGVLMAGMMRAAAVTGDERYSDFVRKWADHWRQKSIGPVLGKRGYCGHWGPGFPVLMLHEETGDKAYLDMAGEIVDFMMKDATRTRDGGLDHWHANRQLWVDTLFMSCPVFATYSRLTKQPKFLDEAAQQLIVSANHLQDPDTGLFYHMYDEAKDERTEELWGRGNGWTAMAYIEVLRHLDRRSHYRERLGQDFRRLARSFEALQDRETGLWHTVLDRTDSYLETSASAMILYSLLEGVRLKIIDLDDGDVLGRAWAGLSRQVSSDGRVTGVSAGTGPGTYEQYVKISRGTQTWGTGAFLLAAASSSR